MMTFLPSYSLKTQTTLKNPKTQAMISHCHTPSLSSNQCGSVLVQTIHAPLTMVWSLVKCFDNPQAYKRFIRSCTIVVGDGSVGSVREVEVISGLPAGFSVERLDEVNEEMHVIKFIIVGGDHRHVNYRSTTSLHEDEQGKTVVIESYTVDVPAGSSKEDTCAFTNTIVGCNLKCLASTAEEMACNANHIKII